MSLEEEIPLIDVPPDVSVGTDGFLYLIGGAQSVLDYASGRKPISEKAIQRFSTNLKTRHDLGILLGVEYVHCVCPDKHSVIPEHFPYKIELNVADEFRKHTVVDFLYPVQELRASSSTFGYLKTDTHWNYDGRVAVARAVLGKLGMTETDVNVSSNLWEHLRKSHQNYCGDLGNKVRPPIVEAAETADKPGPTSDIFTFSNNIKGNNGLIITLFNKSILSNKRLLVFGDSFILHCLHMMSFLFRETLFVRSPYLHREIVENFQPTHLVTSSAERYLPNTMPDADAPLGLLMAGLAGKMWDCDLETSQAINAALQPNGPHNRNFWNELNKR